MMGACSAHGELGTGRHIRHAHAQRQRWPREPTDDNVNVLLRDDEHCEGHNW